MNTLGREYGLVALTPTFQMPQDTHEDQFPLGEELQTIPYKAPEGLYTLYPQGEKPYNAYFGGVVKTPPWQDFVIVEKVLKILRVPIQFTPGSDFHIEYAISPAGYPINGGGTMTFKLDVGSVKLEVRDKTGALLKTFSNFPTDKEMEKGGLHRIEWDGAEIIGGTGAPYTYTLFAQKTYAHKVKKYTSDHRPYFVDVTLQPAATRVSRDNVTVDPVGVFYTIEPLSTQAQSINILILEDGVTKATLPANVLMGMGYAVWLPGQSVDINKLYEAQVVLNPETGDQVTSEKKPIVMAQVYVDTAAAPNLLYADGAQTTSITVTLGHPQAGKHLELTADVGTVTPKPIELGLAGEGYPDPQYQAGGTTVKDKVKGTLEKGTKNAVSFPTQGEVYNDKTYHFDNLTLDIGSYTNDSFVISGALTAAQIQTFLEQHGSFLATFVPIEWNPYDCGPDRDQRCSTSEIIKRVADTYGINPKILLATLQKESQPAVITLATNPGETSDTLQKVMGCGLNRPLDKQPLGFVRQVQCAAQSFANRFNEFAAAGSFRAVDSTLGCANHLYYDASIMQRVPVAFRTENASTYAQHKYTTQVNEIPRGWSPGQAGGCPGSGGGVVAFVKWWRDFGF